MIRKDIDWNVLAASYAEAEPYPHIVIDDFFEPAIAEQLEADIPAFNDSSWMEYNNPIEKKRVLNHWDRFPKTTYQVFQALNAGVLRELRILTGIDGLTPDIGLHGGGWHLHGRGGKLNVHLDYSIHPKMGLERRLNLIVYLTKGWRPEWGGALELWTHDPARRRPKERAKAVDCLFNRAVIFDTTFNSWHGLPEPVGCPDDICRKSIALYYLTPARQNISDRGKALFAPHGEQERDPEILELIRKRSGVATASSTYRFK